MIKKQKTGRVWELDASRGLMILAMLIGHLRDTVYYYCIEGIYSIDPYWWANTTDPLHCWFRWGTDGVIYMNLVGSAFFLIWEYVMQASYFIISGICCTFSRNHIKDSFKLLIWAILLSAYTYLLYRWTGDTNQFMRFSVIMCMALCHLIYEFAFKDVKSKTLLILSIPMLVVGYYLKFHPMHSDNMLLHFIGIRQYGDINEYFPIFPYLGWLFIGAVIGRTLYADKQSHVHCSICERLTRPAQWIGRYSGVIYLAHVVIYRTAFPAIGYLLHLM